MQTYIATSVSLFGSFKHFIYGFNFDVKLDFAHIERKTYFNKGFMKLIGD